MKPTPARALVVKPGSLGDVIHALPTVAAMGRAWPDCRIAWLIDARWAPLLEGNPHVTEIIEFPRARFRGPLGCVRGAGWALGLRGLRPGVALDLQGLLRSALIARAASPRTLFGLGDAREGATLFYDKVVRIEPREHSVLRYLRACEALGIPQPAKPEFPLPPGTLPAETPKGKFFVVHPFARGEEKSLSEASLHALCAALCPMQVALVGGPRKLEPLPPHVTNLLGKTSISELLGLLGECAGVISVDSGPAHLAAALGKPLLALHTWSNAGSVGPFDPAAWIWQAGEIRPQDFRWIQPRNATSPDPRACIAIARHALQHFA